MKSPAATLDTNLLLEYWNSQRKRSVIDELIDLARRGEVDLAVTARIREDVPMPPLSESINRLPELSIQETASVARLGFWVLGRDMLGSDSFEATSRELSEKMVRRGKKPPDWRDWDHLHAHYLSGRGVFLTWDGAILELAPELSGCLGVIVLTPEEWLDGLDTG